VCIQIIVSQLKMNLIIHDLNSAAVTPIQRGPISLWSRFRAASALSASFKNTSAKPVDLPSLTSRITSFTVRYSNYSPPSSLKNFTTS